DLSGLERTVCANEESAIGWWLEYGDEDLVRYASRRAPALYQIVLGLGESERPARDRPQNRRPERVRQADRPVRQLDRLGGGWPRSNELGASHVLRRKPRLRDAPSIQRTPDRFHRRRVPPARRISHFRRADVRDNQPAPGKPTRCSDRGAARSRKSSAT